MNSARARGVAVCLCGLAGLHWLVVTLTHPASPHPHLHVTVGGLRLVVEPALLLTLPLLAAVTFAARALLRVARVVAAILARPGPPPHPTGGPRALVPSEVTPRGRGRAAARTRAPPAAALV